MDTVSYETDGEVAVVTIRRPASRNAVDGPTARALNGGRTTLPAAGLVGAVVVLAGDYVGAYAFADLNLPVGVVTGACGAPFLLWLLARGPHSAHRTGRRAA